MDDSEMKRAHLRSLLDEAINAVEAFRAADEAHFNEISGEWERMTKIRDRRERKFLSRSVSATHALKALVDIRHEL